MAGKTMVDEPDDQWMRWNARSAFSAIVHLVHSAVILGLTLLVQPPAGTVLRYAWGTAAFVSIVTLLVFLRVGSYAGTTKEEVGSLIRRGYWTATGTYILLAVVSLFYIIRRGLSF